MHDFIKMIRPEHICEIKSHNKKDVLIEMCNLVEKDPAINNPEKFIKAILDREKVMSTGIGMGVAIPHAKTNSVSDFVIALGRAVNGIDFESLDGLPVNIVILIGAPHSKDQEFLKVIAKIGYLFNSTEFKSKFLSAPDISEIHKLLAEN